jgi:outer membrane murein-binding lipoprotein Lpp
MKRLGQSRAAALLSVAAVGGGLALAGCGSSDDVSSALDTVQKEGNKALDEAQKQLNDKVPEAQKQLKKAQKKANKAINKVQNKAEKATKDAQKAIGNAGY